MRSWGVFLVALGGLSFVWPLMGRQSMILSMFGEYERPAALGVISAGVVLVALSFRKKKPPA
jgi:hypothetical protein